MTNENSRSPQANDSETSGKKQPVTVTYLEQTERPSYAPPPHPTAPAAILRVKDAPVHFYRYLFRQVGDPWNWVSRRRMDDEALRAIIHHPDVHLHVLYVDGAPAGFSEIDCTNPDIHEIKFFGLAPDYLGRNLGRYFLVNVIDLAWAGAPKKVQLETCTLDHPAALPLYQKYGFVVFDQREGVVELMEKAPYPN
ncbi:MAG: GNAT family N-acetyltransferase [Pseudomonadota bacterium]